MANEDLVYLVNAGNDSGMSAIANDYSFPALGVLALGTWLKNRVSGLEVVVRDGGVYSQEKVLEDIARLKPGLVGVSTLCTSYQNSLEIAGAAKEAGAQVVFGNDQASQTSRLILEHQPNVDFVLGAEYGELPLEALVRHARGEDIPLDKIPSLTFRSGGDVVGFDYEKDKCDLSLRKQASGYLGMIIERGLRKNSGDILDIFPIADRNLYPKEHWENYLQNYNMKFKNLHKIPVSGVTTMNRVRGCSRRGDDVCKHCDISGVRIGEITMSSPKVFWEEVVVAHNQVGANVFYEACDSFSSFPGLIERIAEARPSNLGFFPQFFVYAQAIDLAEHPDRVDMLKEMGVFRVNLGLESMSDITLKHMKGQEDSVVNNYRALQLLKDKGIHVYASFVLGSEAETRETLFGETIPRVCELIQGGYIVDAEAQPVLPLHGNYQGMIMKKHGLMHGDVQHPDWPIKVDDLSRKYVNEFSKVGYGDCIEAARIIRETARKYGANFGSGVSSAENYK